MAIEIGDLVIRKSHGGDIVFRVSEIIADSYQNTYCVLKGLHMRLVADAPLDDIERITAEELKREILQTEQKQHECLTRIMQRRSLADEERATRGAKKYAFFDLPGKVLHIDGDEEYLKMCLKTYRQLHLEAVGEWIHEQKQPDHIVDLLKQHRPDIVILTGHDAVTSSGKKDLRNINSYRHSKFFVQSVLNARSLYPSRDDLVIFAGACQSHFEAIIMAGANFASSPTRIFIHAYDPVFIAEKVAFTSISSVVDLGDAITASVTGIEGVGGVETKGKFRLGLPKTSF